MQQFHKAQRKKGKLRLAIAGPAGSGKTYSALLIAFGIGGKVGLIDTERGSGELYDHLGDYDVCAIAPPFLPKKYVEAIRAAEDGGYDVIILDSVSHAWAGQGGLLDMQGHIADESGNSWTAWRHVTPKHDEMVEAMLQSQCHIIATMRSKMEYAQVEEDGKKKVKKLGMSPVQRNGMEYEFTTFIDIGQNHVATTSKDRTGLFDDQYFIPTIGTGESFRQWLEGGMEILETAGQEKANSQKAASSPDAADPRRDAAKAGTHPHAGYSRKRSFMFTKGGNGGNGNGNGNGNGIKHLFAEIAGLNINEDAYRLYCHRRYEVESMQSLVPEQIQEQIKLLASLRRPARLEEFKALLDKTYAVEMRIAELDLHRAAPDLSGAGINPHNSSAPRPVGAVSPVSAASCPQSLETGKQDAPEAVFAERPVDMPGFANRLLAGPRPAFTVF